MAFESPERSCPEAMCERMGVTGQGKALKKQTCARTTQTLLEAEKEKAQKLARGKMRV